ncbi:MarR family transcriptional regulator [Nocardia yunnanensis]|uniref:MarR family transcriptional regulator n=1 Tax=Nocardia yunnanensis TaxID=2382165 RepID=A0A386ZNS1_9NOCA|nr:MarR family transcriptional regulator [Nocardia yunnanensis]
MLELQRATHATLQVLASELVTLKLNPSEINVLANLADGRCRTVSELAREVGSRPTTLTSMLDRLEGRGLLGRATRAGDRRVVVIELTDAGLTTARTIRTAFTRLERRALAGLPADQVAALRAGLRALAEVSP